jgi:hypothetical protein
MPKALITVLVFLLTASPGYAQGVREHTRPRQSGTTVSESQAVDLTLTLTQASIRPIQTWVRTAGTLDKTGKVVTVDLYPPDARLVKVGQRARTFPVESRSSMYQARVTRVVRQGQGVRVDVELMAKGRENTTNYVVEIVTSHGDLFSVPNEAIIEEGNARVVYVQRQTGQYQPQEIHTGIQGELYTQVLDGLKDGDQVVTFGSFFIDSEYKLKGTAQSATP